jgi:hypothetical protein
VHAVFLLLCLIILAVAGVALSAHYFSVNISKIYSESIFLVNILNSYSGVLGVTFIIKRAFDDPTI